MGFLVPLEVHGLVLCVVLPGAIAYFWQGPGSAGGNLCPLCQRAAACCESGTALDRSPAYRHVSCEVSVSSAPEGACHSDALAGCCGRSRACGGVPWGWLGGACNDVFRMKSTERAR